MQEEESERRVVAVTGFLCCVKDAFRCSLVCLVPCAVCRLDCLRFPVALVVGPNAARILAAHPCVSAQDGIQRLFVPVM